MTLTIADIRREVEQIAKIAGDDEAAHSHEDSLREKVLAAIAEGTCEDAQAAAAEVLKTSEIDFFRWCA